MSGPRHAVIDPGEAGPELPTAVRADRIHAALARMGLIGPGDCPSLTPLAGGVSSEVIRVDLASGPILLKRALPRLKVSALWEAPISRNAAEVAWLRAAAAIVPDAVPRVLGDDREAGLFAMTYLDPARYPLWKDCLRDGTIDPRVAEAVAERLARIHGVTAADDDVAGRFPNHDTFWAIRIEPYLLATAAAHPDLATPLTEIAHHTAATRRALIHGDVSPKNILVGPRGPVFLDAECATWGDPAFDLAFCLNHFLLKCVWRPHWTHRYASCFERLSETYLAGVTWEPPASLEARAARLLPALALARIDGKSPVEYITTEEERSRLRAAVRPLILSAPATLAAVLHHWRGSLAA